MAIATGTDTVKRGLAQTFKGGPPQADRHPVRF